MPAPPKLGRTLCDKRVIEVFGEAEPKHRSKADGHIGIAGKIKIDLQAKRYGVAPASENARLSCLERGA